jgi:hypothetical protein
MSIYSGNRIGVASLADVRVNESYTDNDIGTILYESERNDMAFFEAILYSDLTEIRDLREGVITEAEAEEKNEKDKDSAFKKIIDRIKAFWAKIKGFFKSIIDKIAAFCDRDGVKLKYQILEALKYNPKWSGKIEFDGYRDGRCISEALKMLKDIDESFINVKSEEETGRDAVNDKLRKAFNDNDITVSNFAKKLIEKCKKSEKINVSNIEDYLDIIADGREEIANIKRGQKEAEAGINTFLRFATKNEKERDNISKLNKQASTLELLVSTVAKGLIAVVKAHIAAVRKALGKALASIRKSTIDEEKAEEAAAVAEMAIAFA